MEYAAIYPQDVIAHHRAERPSDKYRDLTAQEWDKSLAQVVGRAVGR